MDVATIIGLILGIGLIVVSISMGGGGMMSFINVPSLMITIGGAFSALLINFPLGNVVGVLAIVKNCFTTKLLSPAEVVNLFGELATVSRKEGLLALEKVMEDIKDPLLVRGLELTISGTPKEELQVVLETEISSVDERHRTGKKILDALAAAAPAFGMIGTLIGLVQMLRTLDDPSRIGGGMATALLTTLYGAVVANLFCIPLAGKLDERNKEEMMIHELMLVGLCMLVDGQTPRAMQERLNGLLAPKQRSESAARAA